MKHIDADRLDLIRIGPVLSQVVPEVGDGLAITFLGDDYLTSRRHVGSQCRML
jgi:hypothetical protein